MAPIVLKIKGDMESIPFNSSIDELSNTWKVCTKVKDSLENGSRLENLSWRLWFSQHKKHKQQQKPQQPLEMDTTEDQFALTADQTAIDDIFNDMQAYLNPLEENPTSQQLDHLINESWPLHDSFMSNTPAFYVSESMPAIPTGTLHNKLISTPNTPFITPSTSFSTPYYHQTSSPSPSYSKSLPPSRATSPPPDTDRKPSEENTPICSNCNTTSTPLWRRSTNDELLCNACGL